MVRRVFFWLHLTTGITAGLVILVMAATGALLAFEPQLVDWAERDLWSAAPPTPGAARLPLAHLVATAQDARGGERATTVTVPSDPASSIRVGFGRDGALYVHPYTGAIIGPASRTHDVLHVIEDWHRWLGSRDLGRPITGVCNLAFLGLPLSGLFLWWPRGWSRRAGRRGHLRRALGEAAGRDMILYPATSLHRVNPVRTTAGALLFDLDMAINQVSQAVPDHAGVVSLTSCYHNLLRQWADA